MCDLFNKVCYGADTDPINQVEYQPDKTNSKWPNWCSTLVAQWLKHLPHTAKSSVHITWPKLHVIPRLSLISCQLSPVHYQ